MDKVTLINVAYLIAAILFILGLKGLTHPRTAVRGNMLGALGMLVAILATLVNQQIIGYGLIVVGVVIGAAIGVALAIKIAMTDMPQLVALFNGFGGGASVLVAGAELIRVINVRAETAEAPAIPFDLAVAVVASGLIGAVTFWGSLVAFAKLQEIQAFRKPFEYPFLKMTSTTSVWAMVGLISSISFNCS